ncbi:MAG: heme biosynthesis protein HemY [Dongiaceae bacterium]
MLRAIFYFIVLAIGFVAVALVANRPGAVTLLWFGYRIETSAWVIVLAIAVATLVLASAWRLLRWILRSPGEVGRRRTEKRRAKAYRALTQGLVAVAAGDAGEARRQAKIARGLLHDPPLTLLLEAQAAQLSGDEQAARRYFDAMMQRPETSFLGLRGRLMQSLKARNHDEALQLARQAASERPNAGWAASTLLDLELKSGDWTAAGPTLRRAEKLRAIEPAAAKRTRAVMLAEQARVSSDPDSAIDLLRDAVKLAPDLVPARIMLARHLGRVGRGREAGRLIEQGWGAMPHPELAAVYGELDPSADQLARVRRFERLVAVNPEHLESHLALAEANLAAALWGAARTTLDQARNRLAAGESLPARLARLMARLEEADGGDAGAARRWLIAAAETTGDAAWICERCGTAAKDWAGRCGHCHEFDSLQWRSPMGRLSAGDGLPAMPTALAPPPSERGLSGSAVEDERAERRALTAAPIDAARSVN